MFVVEEVSPLLDRLIGTPFTGIGRALDMAILAFGRDLSSPDEVNGDYKVSSEYALHVQCPFRLSRRDSVLLGSEDLRRETTRSSDTEYRVIYDRRSEALDQILSTRAVLVETVNVNELGDLCLELSQDLEIRVFPARTYKLEAWRFVIRGAEHIVFPDGVIMAPPVPDSAAKP
ncbi:MAG: hypothetical protein ACJ73S_01520 [Mycobacteriales bacterium]|jgi:hypothetical protein